MAEENAGTDQPLQTVGDALGAQNNDVFERFAESLLEKPSQKADEPKEPEQPKAEQEPEATPDNTADLSQTPEAKADEDDHSDEGLNADQKARIQKRIDKEVAKRKAAEEKAAQSESLRAELESLKANQAELQKKLAEKPAEQQPEPEVDGIDPRLLTVPEIKKIWDTEKQAEKAYETSGNLLKLLKRDPERVIKDLEKLTGNKVETDEDAKDLLNEIRDRALRKHLAAQGHRERATDKFWQNLNTVKQAQSQEARKHYEWLNKLNDKSASGPEIETAKKVLERFPTLLDYADGEKLLGHLVAGELNFAKPKAEPAKPTPVIPPKPPANPKAPVRSNGSVEREALSKRAETSGGKVEDLAALMPV